MPVQNCTDRFFAGDNQSTAFLKLAVPLHLADSGSFHEKNDNNNEDFPRHLNEDTGDVQREDILFSYRL